MNYNFKNIFTTNNRIMRRSFMTIILCAFITNISAQGIIFIEEIFKPILVDFNQKQFIDSTSKYLNDFDENTFRFRIKDKKFFDYNDNNIFFILKNNHDEYLNPSNSKNDTISQLGMEIKLGSIEYKDKKKLRDFKRTYKDFCTIYSNFESRSYEISENNRHGYGTEFFQPNYKWVSSIKVELYRDGKEQNRNSDKRRFIGEADFYIRFTIKK